jgi:adenosylmethionine---8-amino-7-oxononanoate aminotransferase
MSPQENCSEAVAWDRAHSWHPFTPMEEWTDPAHPPLVIVSGKGAVLRAEDGREFLDGNSSIWTNLHGHAHPKINAAIVAQLERVAHVSYLGTAHGPASKLARRLVEFFPPGTLERVFFSDDGSTAIEVALKMCVQYWQLVGRSERTWFVAFDRAYHGDTGGAASLGGVPLFHDRFAQWQFPILRVRTVEELAGLAELQEGKVAGVVIEPLVQGVNRVHLWPQGMLADLRRLCDEREVCLILDEVMTGFGRTGTMFACEQEGVVPDFLCLAKGLTGGYLPLAATLTTRRVYEAFLGPVEEMRTFFYGHSYTANALGCAAALASLEIFQDEKVLARIGELSEHLRVELGRILTGRVGVGEIRQIGLVAGIDLVQADGTAWPAKERVGFWTCQRAREFGLLTRNIGDTVLLMPPYCSTPGQITQMVEAVGRALQG